MAFVSRTTPIVVIVDQPTAALFAEAVKNYGAWAETLEAWRQTARPYLVYWQSAADPVAHTCTPATDEDLRQVVRYCLHLHDNSGVRWSLFVEDAGAIHQMISDETLLVCIPEGNA